jgi:hypothetical protein
MSKPLLTLPFLAFSSNLGGITYAFATDQFEEFGINGSDISGIHDVGVLFALKTELSLLRIDKCPVHFQPAAVAVVIVIYWKIIGGHLPLFHFL